MDRGESWRARDELEKHGHTKWGSIGNRRRWIALTPAGEAVARASSWSIRTFKSAEPHQAGVDACEWKLASETVRCYSAGASQTLETIREVQPDLLLTRTDGRRVVVQVSSTNAVAAELAAIRALAADQDLHRILLVALERTKRDAFAKAVRAEPLDQRVRVLDIEQLLHLAEEKKLDALAWGDA